MRVWLWLPFVCYSQNCWRVCFLSVSLQCYICSFRRNDAVVWKSSRTADSISHMCRLNISPDHGPHLPTVLLHFFRLEYQVLSIDPRYGRQALSRCSVFFLLCSLIAHR